LTLATVYYHAFVLIFVSTVSKYKQTPMSECPCKVAGHDVLNMHSVN